MSSLKQIAIIGAGVIGATTAIRLQELFLKSVSITIFSDEFSPNTTGDVSAGLWGPYLTGDTPPEKILKWSKDTHDFFHKLWLCGDAAAAGVCLLPVTEVTTGSEGCNVPWRDIVFGFIDLDTKSIERLSKRHNRNYKSGIHYTTFTCEPTFLLPYLYKRIQSMGGHIKRRRIESFDDLNSFDLVINCAGLGAQVLIKDDIELKPIRGQVMRIKAPWITEVLASDELYIIPNMNTIVLGGTHQESDYNTNVDVDDTRFIYDGCSRLNASIKRAEIVMEKVGLRPGRNKVRLEQDIYTTKNGKKLQIIHNYGHGGSGVTLAYGCAIEVTDIVKSIMNRDNFPKCKL